MPFKHACFISYRRSGQAIVERFVRDLEHALEVELAPMLDLGVCADLSSDPRAAERYDLAVARALCESVSMVLVFTPTYFSEAYIACAREFRGMEALERKRLAAIGSPAESGGLILPVVLRGAQMLPEELRQRQCFNFDRFMIGDTRIYRSPGFRRGVSQMAASIYQWHERFRRVEDDLTGDCQNFRLPSEQEVLPWVARLSASKPTFPVP